MKTLYPKIKIVPMATCLTHEGIVEKWVDQIAANIMDQGIMKNPIIVAPAPNNKWIVIDGMHRFAACKKLELKDILVCEIDYHSDQIRLEGWDAFTFKKMGAILSDLFPTSEGYEIRSIPDAKLVQDMVRKREALLGACDKGSAFHVVSRQGVADMVSELIAVAEKIDKAIDARKLKPLYVADSTSISDFENSDAKSMVIRPHFTKSEVIEHTLNHKLFPRKSTRHLIPNRPLRIDINLSLLRASVPLEAKNQLLTEHLKWCFESDRIRFYPESVYIFSD